MPPRSTAAAVILFTVTGVFAVAGPVRAEPTCTSEAKERWMPEDRMKQMVARMGYKDIRQFKTTDTNCYEIYGYNKEGRRAEVYFNPVNGSVVEEELD